MGRRRDEYSEIYEGYTGDNGDDRDFDYSDLSGYEPPYGYDEDEEEDDDDDDMVQCMFCYEPYSMKDEGNCYICQKCGRGVDKETYKLWDSGEQITFEYEDEDGTYEEIY